MTYQKFITSFNLQPGDPMVDHQPITPNAYFDVKAGLLGLGISVTIRYPDGEWEFLNSWLMGCFAAGYHNTNPAYMPDLYDKFKRGNK